MPLELNRWRAALPAEPRILLAVGGMAGLLLILADLIEDVVNRDSHAFDRAVLLALRQPGDPAVPLGPAWLRVALIDYTSLGSPAVITLVSVLAVSWLLVAGNRRLAVLLGLSIALGAIVEKLMKAGFDRARPDIVPHLVEVSTLSFPSGHAMLSALTYLTIGALLASAQPGWRMRLFVLAVAVLLTTLIGVTRVYLGVHWPTDVLAGWTAGSAWALATWMLAGMIRRAA